MEHPETRRHGVLEHVAHDVDAVVQGVKPHLRGWLHAGTFPVALAAGIVLVVLADGTRETVA
ncbi:MAG TPA: hemolysin III family protein, partial [Actinomycetes bacterium]|nr:hemolysin III family protein [Actinomycetes bacterium]